MKNFEHPHFIMTAYQYGFTTGVSFSKKVSLVLFEDNTISDINFLDNEPLIILKSHLQIMS